MILELLLTVSAPKIEVSAQPVKQETQCIRGSGRLCTEPQVKGDSTYHPPGGIGGPSSSQGPGTR